MTDLIGVKLLGLVGELFESEEAVLALEVRQLDARVMLFSQNNPERLSKSVHKRVVDAQ